MAAAVGEDAAALDVAVERVWSHCALNLYRQDAVQCMPCLLPGLTAKRASRQATRAEPPDHGIGAAASQVIAAKLSSPGAHASALSLLRPALEHRRRLAWPCSAPARCLSPRPRNA